LKNLETRGAARDKYGHPKHSRITAFEFLHVLLMLKAISDEDLASVKLILVCGEVNPNPGLTPTTTMTLCYPMSGSETWGLEEPIH